MHSTLLAKARLGACRRWPAATAAILSLVPVERRGLGTMAVDAHWRLYFDPDYLAAVNSDEAELVILHEVSHLLLRHHERGGAATDWQLWNFATDCSINFRLQAEGHAVPPEWLLPSRLQLPDNQTAEQYYRQLKDQKDAQAKRGGSSSCGANQQDGPPESASGPAPAEQPGQEPVKPGTSGSCADGQQRPWEEPPPADEKDQSTPPAIPKHEQEQVLRDVAERIAKQTGTGAGSWSRWSQEVNLTTSMIGNTWMVGFSVEFLESYLAKLIGAGHRVALCDQESDAEHERFVLRNAKLKQQERPIFTALPKGRQKPLLRGLEDSPGQMNLFPGMDVA